MDNDDEDKKRKKAVNFDDDSNTVTTIKNEDEEEDGDKKMQVETNDNDTHNNSINNNNKKIKLKKEDNPSCPYLDTIERSMLDFDFEASCSVSLEPGPQNIYACLICGTYFRGRAPHTPAYTHSVDVGHFVYCHLWNGKFYCLPDNYEIQNQHDLASLRDISQALHPTFASSEINALDSNTTLCRDLFGRRYLPGFVGLNNLNKTDYINVTVQALAHVQPLRDFFLHHPSSKQQATSSTRPASTAATTTTTTTDHSTRKMLAQQVTHCFGELIRKMWSDKRFKSHVDPHMLIQAISVASKKKYRIGHQAEAGEFMAWLLHQLHIGLGGSDDTRRSKKKQKKKKDKKDKNDSTSESTTTIIQDIFQGTVQVTTRRKKIKNGNDNDNDVDDRGGSDTEEEEQEQKENKNGDNEEFEETTKDCNFLQLTLDIAEKPLFRDDDGGLVIPQEPLVTVLKKFDGETFHDTSTGNARCRYRLYHPLPNYLILHLARFKTNQYTTLQNGNNNAKEKNPTIVAFPVRNLDLSRYVFLSSKNEKKRTKAQEKNAKLPSKEQIQAMNVKELKQQLIQYNNTNDKTSNNNNDVFVEKSELVDKVVSLIEQRRKENEALSTLLNKYDLVANITHDSPADVSRTSERGSKHDPLQEGSYKCHVQHRGTKQWYEIQDLHVTETMPQLIGLSESYVLIFERKK